MTMTRNERLWLIVGGFRVVGVIGVILICVLSLVSGEARPHSGLSGTLEHILAYGLAGAVLAFGWRSPWQRLAIVVGLFVLAGMMEFLQSWVPDRSSDPIVAILSGASGAIGVLLAAGFAAPSLRAISGLARTRVPNRSDLD
jgi:hypothetical protein